jgi:hypothetical protein
LGAPRVGAEPERRTSGRDFAAGVDAEFIIAESRANTCAEAKCYADADADVTVTVSMPDRVLLERKGR